MKIFRGFTQIKDRQGHCVATIGNFDGVHRGHQQLIQQVKKLAQDYQLPATIITFEPHPQDYFHKGSSPISRLMRLREKLLLFAEMGIDQVIILPFNQTMASMSAADFVEKVLVAGIGIKHLIIGDDFHFGYKRQGDFEFLVKEGKRCGYQVTPTETFMHDDRRVSSQWVRETLQASNLTLAQALLGRPYTFTGRVAQGDQRGRHIGFPTINFEIVRPIAIAQGVYCVKIHGIGPKFYYGVANLGTRPTFAGSKTLLEVHIFSFQQEIYGQRVTIEFVKKLRDEQRFESFDLLKAQIAQDVLDAKDYFGIE